MQYHNILRDYLREYAIPAMLEQGWAFKPAKSYGWEKAQRGPEYHVDQPLRTHILNGLYALTRVLEYLKEKGYYRIGENDFKRTSRKKGTTVSARMILSVLSFSTQCMMPIRILSLQIHAWAAAILAFPWLS